MNYLEKYHQLLKRHDWYYSYSDDFNAWQQGNKEYAVLRGIYKTLDPIVAKEIWNQYAPPCFKID